jgi:hypothetical protein
MSDLGKIRAILMDAAVGQASDEDLQILRQALGRSPALREEQREIERTIGFLRSVPEVRPSPSFRARLERRLDRLEGAEPASRWQSGKDSLVFHLALVGYRLRTVPALRVQLAAALLILAVGMILAAWGLGSRASVSPSERHAEVPTTRADHGVPPGDAFHADDPETDERTTDETRLLETFRPREEPPVLDRPTVDPLPLAEEPLEERPTAPESLRPMPRVSPPSAVVAANRPPRPADETWKEQRPSVRAALRWLARQQRADGSWSARDGEADLGVAVSSLSLLAFVRAGFEEGDRRGQIVDRARAYLQSRQDESGCFGRTLEPTTTHFNHATACLALLETHAARRRAGDDEALDADQLAFLQHGIDYLELVLLQVHDPVGGGRCNGQNLAWVALGLATADASGDFLLAPRSRLLAEGMLRRLAERRIGSDADTVVTASLQTVHAMFEWQLSEAATDEWELEVQKIMLRPARHEASLRYLVAASLYPGWQSNPGSTRESRRELVWESFYQHLVSSLEAEQEPNSGVFPARRRWVCFDGGDVYETALAVLALQLPHRAR